MVEGGAVLFSIVYFDGERETYAGNVMVDSSLNFKIFQSVISQMIGISPDRFSVHLASFEINRQIPITGEVNLAAVASEKDAFFFVERSRKNNCKTQKECLNGKHDPPTKFGQTNKNSPPENVMLLRRGLSSENPPFPGYEAPIVDQIEYYERLMMKLPIERERYLHNMGLNDLSLCVMQ